MGNCCDCFGGSKEEQEYLPIETVEVSQPRGRPVEPSVNNYQSIIDRASSDFISSKSRVRIDGGFLHSSSEGISMIRSKLQQAKTNPELVCSPPTTSLLAQGLLTRQCQSAGSSSGAGKGSGSAGGAPEAAGSLAKIGGQSVISLLHAAPLVRTEAFARLEGQADELALIITKQTEKSVDDASSGNGSTAVVSFTPFEGTLTTR